MYPIKEVTAVLLAFPANIDGYIPDYKDIPEEFKGWNHNSPWVKIQERWFFKGLFGLGFVPKEGVDAEKAFNHLSVIQRSFAPKHEHKMAAVGYLFSEWFDDVLDENGKSLIHKEE